MMDEYYTSTRDNQIKISAKEAIVKGFADDKGLFVLPTLPTLEFELSDLKDLDYQGIAKRVLTLLLPDFSETEIDESIKNAYSDTFSNEAVTPLKDVDDFHVLELFHGPTSAFKDVGLQMLPQLMGRSVQAQQQVMILAATSGDTGTAALDGFKDQAHMGITVFFPDGGVSAVQEQQMLTTNGKNTNVAAIAGNFDDAQTNVKKIFNDAELKAKLGDDTILSSANSINIGRLIPQVVYYFSAYQQLLAKGTIKLGEKVSFTVPTGNFGDILAGYYAKQLGLPVEKLVVACNENNVLADFFATGVYDRNRPFFKTIAPSMDIQVSSNFERLLYYMSGQNSNYIKQLMEELEATGKYRVSNQLRDRLLEEFACGYSSNRDIEDSIQMVYDKYHYLMDPHTASGYKVMREAQSENPEVPMILLSTASPYKFVAAVADALFGKHEADVQVTTAKINDYTGVPVPEPLQAIWQKQPVTAPVIEPTSMADFVYQKVNEVFGHD